MNKGIAGGPAALGGEADTTGSVNKTKTKCN